MTDEQEPTSLTEEELREITITNSVDSRLERIEAMVRDIKDVMAENGRKIDILRVRLL